MYMDFYVVVAISAYEVSEQVAELGNHVGDISCSAFVGVLRITALTRNKPMLRGQFSKIIAYL